MVLKSKRNVRLDILHGLECGPGGTRAAEAGEQGADSSGGSYDPGEGWKRKDSGPPLGAGLDRQGRQGEAG